MFVQYKENILITVFLKFSSAGIDTSRLTLRWAILHIVAYPDIQAKCQDEIDRVVGKYILELLSQFYLPLHTLL